MGSVGVIRKELQQVLTPTGLQMQYAVGQSNSAPQSVAGVNPEGMAGLQINPLNQQMEARPQMDASGKNEIGVYEGDKYGAKALNQMKPEASMSASGAPGNTYQRGRLNPMRYLPKGGQDTGQSAANVAFDRGASWGQAGHGLGEGLATGLGIMGGAVALANAGAQGQDAFSGGLNAFQMGQMAHQQTKKPLSEGLGNVGANVAGRSVGVTKPEVASPTPVAVAPPTTTHNENEMINMRGAKGPIMTQGTQGFDVPFESEAGRRAANRKTREAQGHDMSVNTNEAAVDLMGQPTHIGTEKTGVVTGGGPQGTLPSGDIQRDIQSQQSANQDLVNVTTPQVAEPTTEKTGNTIGVATGQKQLAGAPDPNADSKAAETIAANTKAAEAMSGKGNPSATEQSMLPKKMVGVSGSKRMVGVC